MVSDIIARLGIDTAGFDKGIKKAQTSAQKFGRSMKGMLAAAGVGGMIAMGRRAIDLASQIDDVSKKLDMGSESLQAYQFAGREVGMTTESVNTALQRFSRRIGQAASLGKGELIPIFEKYNIALRNTDGSMRSVDEIMREFADKVKGAGTQSERLAMMMSAVDTEGVGLVTVFQNGADGLDALARKAREAGQIMGSDMVRQLADAENQIEQFEKRMTIAAGWITKKFMDIGSGIGSGIARAIYGTEEQIDYQSAYQQIKAERVKKGERLNAWEMRAEAKKLMAEWNNHDEKIRQNIEERQKKEEEAHQKALNELALEKQNTEEQEELQKEIKEQTTSLRSRISAATKAITAIRTAAQATVTGKDPGKMTIRELANIGRFQAGVDPDVANQSVTAREILQLERQAEKARLSGKMAGPFGDDYESLTAKAQGLREKLFRAGTVSSGEISEATLQKIVDEKAGSKLSVAEQELKKQTEELSKIEKNTKMLGKHTE